MIADMQNMYMKEKEKMDELANFIGSIKKLLIHFVDDSRVSITNSEDIANIMEAILLDSKWKALYHAQLLINMETVKYIDYIMEEEDG